MTAFTPLHHTLPKITVIGYAKRNPLALIVPSRATGEQYEKILQIQTTANPDALLTPLSSLSRNDDASGLATPPPRQDEFDLRHIPDANLLAQIFNMLHKYESMWNGNLRTIKATEHWNDLKPRPVRSTHYSQGPSTREHNKTEINKMLAAGVIDPHTNEWASAVDSPLRNLAIYG